MQINRIEKTVRDEGLKVTYEAADTSGSTANVAVVTESHVIVASVGDSRAVLVYRDANNQDLRVKVGSEVIETHSLNMPQPLSVDHKPGLDEERNRIEKAGGRVTEYKVFVLRMFDDM
jgi:protein phosphatase 2C